jgi:hypothetical protein
MNVPMVSSPIGQSIDAATLGTDAVEPLDPEATIRLPALSDVASPPALDLDAILHRLTPPVPVADDRPLPRFDAEPSVIVSSVRRAAVAVRDALVALPGTIARLITEGGRLAAIPLRRLRRPQASCVLRAQMSETEMAMLRAIAQAWGCSPSQVVRLLLLQECRSLSARSNANSIANGSAAVEWAGVRRTLVLPTSD